MKSNRSIKNQDEILQQVIDRFVEREKQLEGNPFLSERVTAEIENIDSQVKISVFSRVFQLAAMVAGIAIIVFTGLGIGTIAGKQLTERNNIVLLNDAHLERIDLIVTE